jgi:uncharacterized membrane protein YraQ (UPF0718 family)
MASSGSGIKGAGTAIALGTLPAGPLYVAFPMTAMLIRKDASFTKMVIFLGSWAALKIPQLMFEAKFLGVSFTLVRFILTLAALILIGLVMETVLRRHPDKVGMKKRLLIEDRDRNRIETKNQVLTTTKI